MRLLIFNKAIRDIEDFDPTINKFYNIFLTNINIFHIFCDDL